MGPTALLFVEVFDVDRRSTQRMIKNYLPLIWAVSVWNLIIMFIMPGIIERGLNWSGCKKIKNKEYNNVLMIQNLSKSFDKRKVLENFEISIK